MAIFNEINKHSKIVGIFIGVGLLFFILGNEFFGQNSIFKRGKDDIGSIAGHSVSREDYQQNLAQSEYDYQVRTGKAISEQERPQVQEMAWNQLINKNVVEPQYEKLGLTVGKNEIIDMVQGKNVHPTVKQLFTNPQTNEFDKSFLKNFLENFDKQEPKNQQLWTNIEAGLPTERLRNKYLNLLKMTNYVTKEEAKREYASQNKKLDIKYVYVPLTSIADSTVSVNDDDIKQYINNHKKQYEVKEGRSIEYIAFEIKPSTKDIQDLQNTLAEIKTEFANTENDSLYVALNSDSPTPIVYKGINELPEELKIASLNVDSVYGPFSQNGKITLFKITNSKRDSIYSMKASHILFKPIPSADNDGKADAAKRANEVLARIKAGEAFETMAKEFGTDGTASRGGDLGWFSEGQMVKPFNDAVLKASNVGLIPTLVATDFGYHIIKVTAPKTNQKYQIASIDREISASEDTKEEIFKKADEFAANNTDTAKFNAAAKLDSTIFKQRAENFKKTDSYVSSLKNPRELIKWAYDEAEVGDVSKVFANDEIYYVAALVGKRDKGIAAIEEVRKEVTPKVIQSKKADLLVEKLKPLAAKSVEEIATTYGKDANQGIAEGITFAAGSIAGLGYDPIAVGTAFGTEKGKKSNVFKGENGVGIIEVVNVTEPTEIADYTSYRSQLKQQRTGREDYVVDEILKKESDIEDNRYKFY